MITFAKYTPKVVAIGTVREIIGQGGTLSFTAKSLRGTGLLCVVLTLANGESGTATCSDAVTKGLRKALEAGVSKKRCLASLIGLNIVEAPNGGNYISAPMGSSQREDAFTVEALATEVVSWESLATL